MTRPVHEQVERARRGNRDRAREAEKLAAANKLFVRDRLALLLDEG
jgi:acetyl-CoA carboxylase carboxyltransferase component